MVTRIWRGWTTRANADAYETLLRTEIVPGIRARQIAGFRSIDLLRRLSTDDEVEFVTTLRFDSIDAVKELAGDDFERAYVPDAARRLLARFDERVGHYETRDLGRAATTASPAAADAPAHVNGIGGVFFKARDPEALSAWYREHLGIDVTGRAPQPPAFEWRELDDPSRVARTVWALFDQDSTHFDPSPAPFMINYRVANLEALLEHLRARGVRIERTEDAFNGRFAWVLDPEGHRVELWQPAAGW